MVISGSQHLIVFVFISLCSLIFNLLQVQIKVVVVVVVVVAKTQTMALPNLPDMPLKHTKKVRLGIKITDP